MVWLFHETAPLVITNTPASLASAAGGGINFQFAVTGAKFTDSFIYHSDGTVR
jgi:hypothetical protein